MIYNLSKSLELIVEAIFNLEKNYSFFLDNNFEILAISKNFEDEYYLNQRLLNSYNIGIMNIIKIKPEKMHIF